MEQAGSLVAVMLMAVPAGIDTPIEGPTALPTVRRALPVELEVPFACGSRVLISQGHNTFSHTGSDAWAWDFQVPEGTQVLAARDGTVRLVRSDSGRGGCDRSFGPDANYVVLSHENGLETQYLHFSRVFVRLGQPVRSGAVIGEVGRTGFSCGAHLHFQLQRAREAVWAGQSVPASFRGIGDPGADEEVVSGNCPVVPAEPLQAAASAPSPKAPTSARSAGEAVSGL
jgi:murein DD-endopeptidase MepM/ murein hydrolase activator NlpD